MDERIARLERMVASLGYRLAYDDEKGQALAFFDDILFGWGEGRTREEALEDLLRRLGADPDGES